MFIKYGDLIIRRNTYLIIGGHRSDVLSHACNFALMETSGMLTNFQVFVQLGHAAQKRFLQWLRATSKPIRTNVNEQQRFEMYSQLKPRKANDHQEIREKSLVPLPFWIITIAIISLN